MELRTIELTKFNDKIRSGLYGSYIIMNDNVGVKLIGGVNFGYFANELDAINSERMKAAQAEANFLSMAQICDAVPRFYGIVLIKKEDKFYIGLMMEHLGTTRAIDHFNAYSEEGKEKFLKIKKGLLKKLEKAGIYHGDLHEENVMVKNEKYYAIDLSPALTHPIDSLLPKQSAEAA